MCFLLLTNDEINLILKKYSDNYAFISYKIQNPSNKITGFLGEYFNLNLKVKNKLKNSEENLIFFLKTLPTDDFDERKLVEESGIIKKEVEIYNLLLESFNKNFQISSKCYYNRPNILVLEDLFCQNYFHVDNFENNHIKAVLNVLAKLHCDSRAFELKNGNIQERYGDILFETSVSKDIPWFQVGLQAIQAVLLQHPKFQTNKHTDFVKNKLFDALSPVYEMVNPSKEFKNVLCHRDAWGKNIFFRKNLDNNDDGPYDCILVDFQTCRYCPPAIDVIFAVYLNAPRILRELNYEAWIEWYYMKLNEYLKQMQIDASDWISKEEIIKSCRELRLFGILYKCIASTIIDLPEGFLMSLRKTDSKKYFQFANVNRSDIVLQFLSDYDGFKEKLYENLEELMEVIYK